MGKDLKRGFGLLAVLFFTASLVFAGNDLLKENTYTLGNLKFIDSELKVASGQEALILPSHPCRGRKYPSANLKAKRMWSWISIKNRIGRPVPVD
jgi:hypothetical protein